MHRAALSPRIGVHFARGRTHGQQTGPSKLRSRLHTARILKNEFLPARGGPGSRVKDQCFRRTAAARGRAIRELFTRFGPLMDLLSWCGAPRVCFIRGKQIFVWWRPLTPARSGRAALLSPVHGAYFRRECCSRPDAVLIFLASELICINWGQQHGLSPAHGARSEK